MENPLFLEGPAASCPDCKMIRWFQTNMCFMFHWRITLFSAGFTIFSVFQKWAVKTWSRWMCASACMSCHATAFKGSRCRWSLLMSPLQSSTRSNVQPLLTAESSNLMTYGRKGTVTRWWFRVPCTSGYPPCPYNRPRDTRTQSQRAEFLALGRRAWAICFLVSHLDATLKFRVVAGCGRISHPSAMVIKLQPPDLFSVVKGPKFQTLGGFRTEKNKNYKMGQKGRSLQIEVRGPNRWPEKWFHLLFCFGSTPILAEFNRPLILITPWFLGPITETQLPAFPGSLPRDFREQKTNIRRLCLAAKKLTLAGADCL